MGGFEGRVGLNGGWVDGPVCGFEGWAGGFECSVGLKAKWVWKEFSDLDDTVNRNLLSCLIELLL